MSAMAIAGSPGNAQQDAGQLLQSGLHKEEIRGDLEDAIAVYERILREFPSDRPVAAKALLHIGLCYEKLGVAKAEEAYQRLLHEFADQQRVVGIARQRLKSLGADTFVAPSQRFVFDDKMIGMHMDSFDFSPKGDRFAFANRGKLYVADQTGTVIRPILESTPPWKQVGALQWSPDGRSIAYVAIKDKAFHVGGKVGFAVCVIGADGELTRRQVGSELTGGIYRLSWAPDGRHLAYQDGDGIHTITLHGQEASFIPIDDWATRWRYPTFSPDGRWLVLDLCDKEKEGWGPWDTYLAIVPATGGTIRRLTDLPGFNAYPTWAADGRAIYFCSGSQSTQNIWRIPMDLEGGIATGKPTQVTFLDDAKVSWPKVVAKGNRIVYQMERSSTSVHIADAASPHESRILTIGRWPKLSPDGKTVYYVDDGILSIPHTGGEQKALVSGSFGGHPYLTAFDLSPDGQTLAYVTKFSDGFGLFTLPAGGGEPKLLVGVNSRNGGSVPAWSPDGTQLAYAAKESLYVIPAIGGKPHKLAHLDLGWEDWTVRWSPDGRLIAAFGYIPSEENAVFVVPSSGGKLRQLTPEDKSYKEGLEWHPDGRRLTYHVSLWDSATYQVYLDGGSPSVLVNAPDDAWDYVGTWAPDGKLFFIASSRAEDGRDGYNLLSYDEPSAKLTTILSDHVTELCLPHWSRDGKTMAWSQVRSTGRQIWVMENFQPIEKR